MDYRNSVLVDNERWRIYRVRGGTARQQPQDDGLMQQRVDEGRAPALPNLGTPQFFENWRWSPRNYPQPVSSITASELERLDKQPNSESYYFQVHGVYQDALDYFRHPRYNVQKILGAGGNGMAVHFKDRGDIKRGDPERDIVVKVALRGRQSNDIVREKKMMKKVKGSAHCVQIINPEEIGRTPEEEVHLPLPEFDSSTDGDSSGNESLNRAEVLKRHRIPKRKTRSIGYLIRKKERWTRRQEEIRKETEERRKKGEREDKIIMEYLQNGSLATLIFKLNKHAGKSGEYPQIPNRVLWGFWLCLIRACIAMEYPPRKFHPLRKKPAPAPEGAIPYVQAKARGMIRECIRLGLQVFDSEKHAQMEAQYKQLEGDLIENLPNPTGKKNQDWKLERRQNMIHRDFDPTNIFVGGLELDDTAILAWEETKAGSSKGGSSTDPSNENATTPRKSRFGYTAPRPDRTCREHELIPRLKLGDFGLAVCIKQQKTNDYYRKYRFMGKHGEHPPESFGPEWEKIDAVRNGYELAESRTCGYYSNKTNIWAIGLTMWELITRYEPPAPPAPQPPYTEVDNYVEYNSHGQTNMDMIFKNPQYADFKVSYCPLILDPRVTYYDWVHKRLRETVFKCLYHKPDDRPSLQELLREAEEFHKAEFPGETDEVVREWIQRWFFDAATDPSPASADPLPPAPAEPLPPPPVEPLPPPPADLLPPLPVNPLLPPPPPDSLNDLFGPAGYPPAGYPPPGYPPADDGSIPGPVFPDEPRVRPGLSLIPITNEYSVTAQQLQILFNADFPYGSIQVPNDADQLRCGLMAVADSLRYQLGLNPTVNGVTYALGHLPTANDLFAIHQRLMNDGAFNDFLAPGIDDIDVDQNFNVAVLAAILTQWGQMVNIPLELGYIIEGYEIPQRATSPFPNPKFIWIYNDNAQEIAVQNQDPDAELVLNHFEGLRPAPRPVESGLDQHLMDDDDLLDYETDTTNAWDEDDTDAEDDDMDEDEDEDDMDGDESQDDEDSLSSDDMDTDDHQNDGDNLIGDNQGTDDLPDYEFYEG